MPVTRELVGGAEPGAGSLDLTEQVRDAIRHLYDYAYLQTHPLTRFVQEDQPGESWGAGLRLGRHLQEAIAALQPGAATDVPSAANRRARLLRLRYLEEMEAPAVQQSLAISRSTYQREHAVALRAVTSLLATRWSIAGVPVAADDPEAADITDEEGLEDLTFLTSFVGRERELAEIGRLLDQTRLVTLTGPPGTGKTRLAGEVAARRRSSYADGSRFVSLAACRRVSEVLSAVARSLGVREAPSRPLVDTVKEALRPRHMLLVLDNFEQVVIAAPLVVEFLRAAPQLTVLATSRALLHVSGEHTFVVPPMTLLASALPSGAGWAASEAVQLFALRAQATQANFALNEASAPTIAEICRRLDGLPLAIELAAARLRVLPAPALLARLDRRLPLLTAGAQDLPARQQTLRAAIDWSYDLLDADQQTLFHRLAVFMDGCTLDAAEHVCGPAGQEGKVVTDLAALVDQGLLRRDEPMEGEARFTMLESIREYAVERLVASGELERLQRAHAACYLRLAEAGAGSYLSLETAEQRSWLDRLETEHDNLRAALRWYEAHGTPDESERLTGALAWFWLNRNYWTEGRYWIDRLPSLADAAGRSGTLALQAAGIFALAQGDLTAAKSRLQRSVALWRERGDRLQLAISLAALATVDLRNRDSAALTPARESLDIFRSQGDRRGVAALQLQLGSAATFAGDLVQAQSFLAESRAYFLDVGDALRVATADSRLGELARVQRDYTAARAHFERSLAAFRALGALRGIFRQDLAIVLTHLGELADRDGDHVEAVVCCREALVLARELGDQGTVAWTLTALGRLARQQGEEQQAVSLFREALQLRQQQGHAWATVGCLVELAEGAMLAGQPERAILLFAAAMGHNRPSAGSALDGDLGGYDRARAEQHLATLRTSVTSAVFAERWTGGAALSLAQAVAYALLPS